MSKESYRPRYYQEDHEYPLHYAEEPNEYYAEPNFAYNTQIKKPVVLPTIDYLNERKCPIYRHRLPHESSIFNNYSEKIANPKKTEVPKATSQNSSKFVLDKLEETYWATWKPKKENLPVKKSPRKIPNIGSAESKVRNKVNKKSSNKPHGDGADSIFKNLKLEEFEKPRSVIPRKDGKKPSITSVSAINDDSEKKEPKKKLIRPTRFIRVNQRDSASQEIQTMVHCPVILEQSNDKVTGDQTFDVVCENEATANNEKLNSSGDKEDTDKVNKKGSKTRKPEDKKNKQDGKNKPEEKGKKILKYKKTKKTIHSPKQSFEETHDSLQSFVAAKDSIDIAKEKQVNSPKEHYQQPKSIRLYRKPGGTSSFIKGGTYPLKSCLKKDSLPNGNFRLGAPGSPLFVTTSSISKRKK